jgi:ATP-dependent Clp protease ATP-binding subunit ClpA
MADHVWGLPVIIRTLENRTHLAEAFLFPEVSRYGSRPERLREALERNVRRIVAALPPGEVYRRCPPGPVTAGSVTLSLDPPPRSFVWREPVELTFPVVRWSHGEEAHLAYVPALGIEVLAARPEDLDNLLPAHIRAALMRTRAAASLRPLVWLQRGRLLRVENVTVTVDVRSPKEVAREAEKNRDRKKSVLREVGTNLADQTLAPAYALDETVALLAELLGGRQPRSVLLIGPSGVGKTAAVHELVRRRRDFGLGATPFWASSGSRLVAGMTGFGMWQERCRQVWQEASRRKAVLHLGNLIELMQVGKSQHQRTGIAHFLRPYLARSDLLAIVECTPEQIPIIEREDPHLLEVFQQVRVEEPSPEKGRMILQEFARAARPGTPLLDAAGLETLDRLHRRYATYSAYPGRPLRFLQNLLNDWPEGKPQATGDVVAAFARETGLPLFLLDDQVALDREATGRWFGGRVIGQPEAVDLVVNLLTTVKAGLTRPRKPIASLLFIGPTGVGKTEMAKALAEFLFGDRNRLTRLDMSEYADPGAVQRLIGGGLDAEGLLTAKVREQPFAVVLLDEFEKAHPLLFDLLLQVLGEGRLTDAAGRLADFCNAVVIMTSNLGAESFQQGPLGLVRNSGDRGAAREHFEREVRRFVRPELFNRIDRIVSFAPLDQETVCRIAERQLELVRQRDGIRFRGVTLEIAPDIPLHLARQGSDPRYGARPLKRALERELLAPLADRMNHYAAETALAVEARLEGEALQFTVRARLDEAGRRVSAVTAAADVADVAGRCTELRRRYQALEHCPAVLEITNDIYRLGRLAKRMRRRSRHSKTDVSVLTRLAELRRLDADLRTLFGRANALEDEAVLALYGRGAFDGELFLSEWQDLDARWAELLLTLYCRQFEKANAVTLAVFGEDPEALFDLARAYQLVAEGRSCRVKAVALLPYRASTEVPASPPRRWILDERDDKWHDWAPNLKGRLERVEVQGPAEFLAAPRPGVVGLAFGITGTAAFPRFGPERGLHVFKQAKNTARCLVHASETALLDYVPPEGVERRGGIPGQEQRRLYLCEQGIAEDPHLKGKRYWSRGRLDALLDEVMEERLRQGLRRFLEP